MPVTNLLQGLFKTRIAKTPELSEHTIEHSLIDKYIHDELCEQATYFRETIEELPELDIEQPDGTVERKQMESAAQMNSDMFYAFHETRDVPRVMDSNKIKLSRELPREVVKAMVEHPDFQKARARTRGKPVGAGLATLIAAETWKQMMSETLAERAKRAEEIEEQEHIIEGYPGPGGATIPNPNAPIDPNATPVAGDLPVDGPGVPDPNAPPAPAPTWEELKEYAKKRREARKKLEELAEQQQQGLDLAAKQAVAQAAEDAKEGVECWANLPGNQPGSHSNLSPDQEIELAREWMKNPTAREVAAMMGRMQRAFRFLHSTHTVSGREIPVDVELGDDLRKLTAGQMMQVGIPELEDQFAMRYVRKQLHQYETRGRDEAGAGPFIMLIDFSGSMGGAREIHAKATALSLLGIASQENRAVTVIAFDTQVLGDWTFPPRANVDLAKALEFASMSPDGGTAPYSAVKRAQAIIRSAPDFKQADIVIVTDGECGYGEQDLKLLEELRHDGIRTHGISIECNVTAYLGLMCDEVIPVYDLSGPGEAAEMLVKAVM